MCLCLLCKRLSVWLLHAAFALLREVTLFTGPVSKSFQNFWVYNNVLDCTGLAFLFTSCDKDDTLIQAYRPCHVTNSDSKIYFAKNIDHVKWLQ